MCISVTDSELDMPTYKPDYSRSGESTFWNCIYVLSRIYKERRCTEWNTWMKLFLNFEKKIWMKNINFKYFSIISEALIFDILIAKKLLF